MGETFWALHHYCWGILKFTRSQMNAYPGVIRYGLQTSALGEFAFVVRTMPEDYVLAPEIYTYIGRTHLLQKHPMNADEAFAHARRLKPDYWPAYSWWATYLADHGQRDKAREIVAEGLKYSPDTKTLQLIAEDLDSPGTSSSKRSASPASKSK
jgi:tetratricopeptide (TPR) repeat protein